MEVDQSQPLREEQVQNDAGGFVWRADDLTRLRRFLVLGNSLPTYYVDAATLTEKNKQAILDLLGSGRGLEVVTEVVKFSKEGRTPKQEPLMYTLAICARLGNLETKRKAYEVLSQVCRIPTHLFMFVDYCQKLSEPHTGWGRAHRNAIKKWYTSKKPMNLALAITKYQKRGGWSHRDIARLMHLRPTGNNVPDHLPCIMNYIVNGWTEAMLEFCRIGVDQNTNHILEFLRAVHQVKALTINDEAEIVRLIQQFRLVREHIPTTCLNSVEIWKALLENMPMTAMIRNLGKMTSIGLLSVGSNETALVCRKLTNEEELKNARIHPFKVLVALKQYHNGHGDRGSLSWSPVDEILVALENAFYKSFKNVQPTNQRFLLALDVSGSMRWGGCAGTPTITPAVASAAMAMVTARTETIHQFVAFSDEMVNVPIDSTMELGNVLTLLNGVPMGGTDCSLPMTYAIENKVAVDVFIVYTDCETSIGRIHPSEALRNYRRHSGINAKLVVVAMTSNGFTIADPDDRGMFDMAGFDSAAPEVMREFIMGEI